MLYRSEHKIKLQTNIGGHNSVIISILATNDWEMITNINVTSLNARKIYGRTKGFFFNPTIVIIGVTIGTKRCIYFCLTITLSNISLDLINLTLIFYTFKSMYRHLGELHQSATVSVFAGSERSVMLSMNHLLCNYDICCALCLNPRHVVCRFLF